MSYEPVSIRSLGTDPVRGDDEIYIKPGMNLDHRFFQFQQEAIQTMPVSVYGYAQVKKITDCLPEHVRKILKECTFKFHPGCGNTIALKLLASSNFDLMQCAKCHITRSHITDITLRDIARDVFGVLRTLRGRSEAYNTWSGKWAITSSEPINVAEVYKRADRFRGAFILDCGHSVSYTSITQALALIQGHFNNQDVIFLDHPTRRFSCKICKKNVTQAYPNTTLRNIANFFIRFVDTHKLESS